MNQPLSPGVSRTHADAQLVADLLEGDEKTFTAFVCREHASMVRYARLFVSTSATAEEVAQEAWKCILEGLHRFRGRSSLRCWMYNVLANCARSRGVRERRSVPLSALVEEDEDGAVPADRFFDEASACAGQWMHPPAPWADDLRERTETLAVVRETIEQLPGLRRQVIALRDVDGFSSEETCALLGISEANQRVLLHRARSRVRQDLERYFARRRPAASDASTRATRPARFRASSSGSAACSDAGSRDARHHQIPR